MKIPNKQELQQIAFNHSSDTYFRDFVNLYKNILQNLFLFLVIDVSDNPPHFRNNLLERI